MLRSVPHLPPPTGVRGASWIGTTEWRWHGSSSASLLWWAWWIGKLRSVEATCISTERATNWSSERMACKRMWIHGLSTLLESKPEPEPEPLESSTDPESP